MKVHFHQLYIAVAIGLFSACSSWDKNQYVEPNYDDLIGKKFSSTIFLGRQGFEKILESDTTEVLERKRGDGCSTVFGVRRVDDVIVFWRVEPSPKACKVNTVPLNR